MKPVNPSFKAMLVISDIVAVSASVICTFFIRTELLASISFVTPFLHDISIYIKTIPFVCALWVWIFAAKGLYRPRRGISAIGEFREIVRSITFGVVIIMAASFLSKFDYSRLIMLSFWICNIITIGSSRAIIRYFQKKIMQKEHGKNRVVVVGTGETARLIVERIKNAEEFGCQVIGIVDDNAQLLSKQEIFGIPFLGQIDDLPSLLKKESVGEVFLAKPDMKHERILNLVAACDDSSASFRIVSDLFEIMTGKANIDNVADIPIIDLTSPKDDQLRRLSKRLMDLSLSAFFLAISLPIWAVVSTAIKLDSKGSVLFRQTRIGQHGAEFIIYKFRTMFSDVRVFEHAPTHKEDARITRVGKILRRTSLDELPQLLNVLIGNMSLVGPRPEMPFIVAQYNTWQRKRLDAKPGITGLWQVLGRKNLPLEENLQYDFYYIKNRSILMDITILLKTVRVVIMSKGAY
ncbi:sugar transferase [bacterium]|nr:sugar transferase [bacterium]